MDYSNHSANKPRNKQFMKLFTFLVLFIMFSSALFAAATLDSIAMSKDTQGYFIVIRGNGNLRYISSVLDNPPRIILDFPDTENKLPSNTIEAKDNPLVMTVRSGDNLESGTKLLRVVIELRVPADYSLSPFSGGFVMRLTAKPRKPATAVTDPYAAPPKTPTPTVAAPLSAPLAAPPPSTAPPILIGAEDLIEVTVFELPQFNVSSRVSGDGTITMPLIGSIVISGLTKQQAEEKIKGALEAKYVNNANVSVNIKEYKSKQVAVLGAVRNPGAYYILSNRSLLQLIVDAGGLSAEAGQRCFVLRSTGQRIEIDLADLMTTGNPKWNIPIYPGDIMNIPTGSKVFVYLLGEIKTPGPLEIGYGSPITLLTAIAKAGGLTANASKTIQIRRKDEEGKVTVLKVNLKDIMKGKKPDVELQPGDVINVPESFF
jgi:polysaccharide export outer membrane protein